MARPTVDEVQPYFRAYMLAHGMTELPPPPHHEFLIWMDQQWREWRAENGFGPHTPLSPERRHAFGEWLRAKTEPAESLT